MTVMERQVPHDLAHVWDLKTLVSWKLTVERWLPQAGEERGGWGAEGY
jgi:hypothetical protein